MIETAVSHSYKWYILHQLPILCLVTYLDSILQSLFSLLKVDLTGVLELVPGLLKRSIYVVHMRCLPACYYVVMTLNLKVLYLL